jgi:hypothetical protein
MHLDHWFNASNRLSHVLIQISNFGEDEIVYMFYDYNLYVLCIVRSHVNHTTPIVKTHDVGGGNHCCVRWNVHLVEIFLRGNKINFYSSNHSFICNVGAKNLSAHHDQWFYVSNLPSRVMMLVKVITVVSGGMFISRRAFYAVTKLFLVHRATNFYATSVSKTFLHILTIDSMHPIAHHVP